MAKVFIAGSSGTTGLRLKSRLRQRSDVELLETAENLRKDPSEIKKMIDRADFVFLCLPDDAANETAELAKDSSARIIDTSTAHRTAAGWAYGFPELSPSHRAAIQSAKFTASPGCHASGIIALVYPLISAGILSEDCPLACTSITGYSGGGKKMISEYENPNRSPEFDSPNLYGMGQSHKHLPEIVKQCGLKFPPVFTPIVSGYYSGMLVTIPLHASMLNAPCSPEDIREIYRKHYEHGGMIKVSGLAPSSLYANTMSGRDDMEIFVSGSEGRILLCSRFDNLGKGASGAAIQCFNLMCGVPEDMGLCRG
ncbi:MAG: N-acetyl-gamma-glutamyl-phosphate reductase [Clostridiales bacterium]|nr:N-acetyl-gamma-glutamyl-phosphate reductase [Clostridiales bacterium]